MKRVVFLCFMLLMFGSVGESSASSFDVFTFDDYEIRATYMRDANNHLGYELVKAGLDPFVYQMYYDNADVRINNIIEVEGNHVIYGYIHYNSNDTYYDGFITIISPHGEELSMIRYDNNYEEDVRHVFVLESTIMVVLQELVDNGDGQYEFIDYKIKIYDHSFAHQIDIDIPDEQRFFTASKEMLLMDQNGDGLYDGGILEDGTILGNDIPLLIEEGMTHTNEVYIPFLNEALINGQAYYNGVYLNYPGTYTIVYQGESYEFSIEAMISGVEDGGMYSEAVTPVISGGQMLLNGDLLVPESQIHEPGNYELTVIGVGDYEQSISFTITSSLQGIYDQGLYQDSVELSFNGTAHLNNTFITSPYTVSQAGDYRLTIEGEDHYQETYEFTLIEEDSKMTVGSFLKQYDFAILGVVSLTGFIILKKK